MSQEPDLRTFRQRTFDDAYREVRYRGPGFDTVRLGAASAVVLHHALHALDDDLLYQWSEHRTQMGFLAVSIFFVLSGFLVTPGLLKRGDLLSYFSHRIMRIMPLLIIVVAFTALIFGPIFTKLPLAEYFANPMTWRYLKNMTTSLSLSLPGVANGYDGSVINGALWTLRYEWLCYIILAGSFAVGALNRRMVFLVLYCMVVVVVAIWHMVRPGAAEGFILIPELWSYFAAGTLVFLFRDRIPFRPIFAWMALFIFFVLSATPVFNLIGPMLLSYVVISAGLIRWPWAKLLARADMSYGVYLTHALYLTILIYVFHPANPFLLFAMTLSLACMTALVSWFALEKPALMYKDAPARIARAFAGRLSSRFRPVAEVAPTEIGKQ